MVISLVLKLGCDEKNKIMKVLRKYINRLGVIMVFVLTASLAYAGGAVTFTASTKSIVEVGERFQIYYTVNADGSNFRAPDFGSLSVLSGPNRSSSSSIQYINGRMSQSTQLTFTFLVMANQEGTINIPPATIKVDGKQYKSNSLSVKVVKGSAPAQTQNGGSSAVQNGSAGNSAGTTSGSVKRSDIYIKALVSNRNPYLGEQVIVTYRIYTKIPVSDLSVQKLSSFPGFWTKDLMDNNKQLQQSTKIINGEQYVVADIRKLALYPQKSGKLTIDPMELECTAQIQVKTKRRRGYDPFDDFFNDPFFNRNVKNVKLNIKSNSLTLNVKELPQENKPASFNGAVGNFTFSAKIDRTKLKVNDAITETITISGSGNLELVEAPVVKFPTDFETYEPKVTSRIRTGGGGVSGYKKFDYLAIPRNPGDFVIPSVSFSFFNPHDKKYYTYSSDEYNIHVDKGSGNSQGITYSGSAQEDIHYIGKDIRHIKTGVAEFKPVGNYFFASNLFYELALLPLLLLFLVWLIKKQREKRRGNIDLIKNKKATKIARSRLQKAEKFRKAGDDKAFFEEIAQALWGYIADKFNVSQAELSMETVRQKLTERGVSEDVTTIFVNVLNDIEFARFAPGDTAGKMENIYNEAMDAILKAEKELKH